MPPDQPPSVDALARLPAERRQHKGGGIVLYSCCCCCCCCLHTIGGAIGASWAGNYHGKGPLDLQEESAASPRSPRGFDDQSGSLPGVQSLFWSSVGIVFLIQVIIALLIYYAEITSNQLGTELFTTVSIGSGAALILLGPLYFLAACVVMAIRIGLSPALRQDHQYFLATGKIAGGTILGTLIGIGIMVGIYFIMVAR
jgi:hypothetical protein